MENVFEPMDNFVDEVFEPMSNFAPKKTPEQKSDDLSTILQKLKKVDDIEKVKTAVQTGGLGAGIVLAKMFLEVQNKKSSFAGNQSFLNDPRIVWDLSIKGGLAKQNLIKKPNYYYYYIFGKIQGQNINYYNELKKDIANQIKKSKVDFKIGIAQLLQIYLKEYGKPYELDLSKYKFNSMPVFGIKEISYNPNDLNDRLNPFHDIFKKNRVNPKLYKLPLVALNQKNVISSFDDFENFEGDDFSNFGLREWFKSKFSTQSTPNQVEEKKIFGMPKKRAISVGVIALAIGITTYLILKNKK